MLLYFVIISISSAIIIGALAYYFIQNSYRDSKEEKFLTNMNLIENTLKKTEEEAENINFHRLAQDLSTEINSRVTFIDREGQVLADSINNSIMFQPHDKTTEFQYAIRGERQIVQRYSNEVGNKFFYLAFYPITVGDNDVVVRLGDDYNEIDLIIESFFKYVFLSAIVGIIFAVLLGYISIKKITTPVKELTEASKLIAQGDFNKKIKVNTKDEIEELSKSFNRMASKLKYTIDELKDKNTKMDAILDSMQEGLIALDKEDKIILVNDKTKEILNIDNKVEIENYINRVLFEKNNLKEIKNRLKCENNYKIEKVIGQKEEKIIEVSISSIEKQYENKDRIGTLIMIRDITSIRKLEDMRKDFVANVSHELRTPLTSITGFIETLKIKELEDESRKKAINIIEFESERLKRLINDLLRLSEIENIKDGKDIVNIDLKKDAIDIIKLLKPLADKKNIDMDLDIQNNLNSINGYEDWFKLILVNLIENSIKYGKENGYVHIKLYNKGEGIELVVEDSGIGIPKEDIPRIFERFYRTDKSRSSTIKGTGLGLAIVKHIVELLKGTIEVESQLDKGTKFTITIPGQGDRSRPLKAINKY